MSHKDDMKRLGIGITKAAIGNIPIAGGLLNQLIFEVRGKIKQARYNKFIDALTDYMNSHYRVQLTIEQIEGEQIGDFFESIVTRVVKISAQKRIDALKRLLAAQIIKPADFDYAESIADLLAGMSEYELLIMQNIAQEGGNYANNYTELYNAKQELEMLNSRKRERQSEIYDAEDSWIQTPADGKLERLIEAQQEQIKKIGERLQPLKTAYTPSTYSLEAWEFYFHLTQLVRKGIIVDESGGLGASALSVVAPNQVAFDMLTFLAEDEEKEKEEQS